LEFTNKWLLKAFSLLKDDGRLCINIPLDTHKYRHQSIYADIMSIAKKISYNYQTTIIWSKQSINKRTAWGSWLSPSSPNIIAPVEVIVVLYKKKWKKEANNKKSDITKEEFIQWTNGLWAFSGQHNKSLIGHPAPFPIELPKRCIKLFSYIGDIVLDPFLGSGSTLIACALTNRQGIGIEIDIAYSILAKQRLIQEAQLSPVSPVLLYEYESHPTKIEKQGSIMLHPSIYPVSIDNLSLYREGSFFFSKVG